MAYERIAFQSSDTPGAIAVYNVLSARYGNSPIEDADVIVAIGGDGFMLQTLHETMEQNLPIYGVNRGTVGFLMNDLDEIHDDLHAKLAKAEMTVIHPLHMTARDRDGAVKRELAINEVALLRETRQSAKIRVTVDNKVRLPELICDGIMVATPAGSTAYNLSAHGPILPIDAQLLALTPISAFRPRRWRGALLPHRAKVRFEILEPEKRPVSAVADFNDMRHVLQVDVEEADDKDLRMLFDNGHTLDERILTEQFHHS